MSNYTNNPSMDEILERIKKALADRERRIAQGNIGTTQTSSAVLHAEEEIAQMAETNDDKGSQNTQKIEQQTSHQNTNIPVDNNTNDIFIKPNLSNTKQSDVYILSKNMKVNSAEKFAETNFPKLFHELSTSMAKDLAIAYMAPKIESWLTLNFAQISSHCRKK